MVGGPTAVGKTGIAVSLAKYFKTEIINADSRQVYRELNIGVNKPSRQELDQIKHHLLGHTSIHDEYNVGIYEKEAIKTIRDLFHYHDRIILTGGTGLYIQAVMHGIDAFPDIPVSVRHEIQELLENKGIGALQAELQNKDPEYFQTIDIHNPRRLTRAIEVIKVSGMTYTSYLKKQKIIRPFDVLPVFITEERKKLYEAIHVRVDEMIHQGLKSEARSMHSHRHLTALQTVGYKEWFDFFEGKCSESAAIEKIKQHTRNYAKRQWTWWRPLNWPEFYKHEFDKIITHLETQLV